MDEFPDLPAETARVLVEHAADVICVVDLDGTLRFVSPSAKTVFGVDPRDVIGHNLLDYLHRDDVDGVLLAFRQAESRGPFGGATRARVRHADCTWRWTDTVGTNLLDDARVRGIVVIVRDISDQVAAEERLRESEASFRHLFFRSPEPMWILDRDTGDFIEVNDAAITAYGYSRAEFEAMSVGTLAGGGTTDSNPGRHRRQHVRRDGAEILVEMSADELDWRGQRCLLVVARDVTDQVRLERQLAHQALHDTLTGLPNRALLYDRAVHVLSLACRHDQPVTLLAIDIDRFKRINDEYGHAFGDAVLRELAWRLAGCVRSPDTVARLGGDEFAILLENAVDTSAGADVARRILDSLRRPVEVRGQALQVTVSIGVATADGTSALDTLLDQADTAMYEAKRAGGARFAELRRAQDRSPDARS